MAWLRSMREVELPEHSRWILDRDRIRSQRLNGELQGVERRLDAVTKDDAVVRKLLSLPGVGSVTAWVLRAEVGRFERFRSGERLARFCGLTPWNASSGARQADAGLIRACNQDLRSVLIDAGHRLKRWDPRWSALGSQLRRAGTPGSVIAAAVANCWVRCLYHVMTTVQAA